MLSSEVSYGLYRSTIERVASRTLRISMENLVGGTVK